MWILASLPLWVLGSFGLFAGVFGLGRIASRPENDPRDPGEFYASIVFLMAAAAFLYLAARVAA